MYQAAMWTYKNFDLAYEQSYDSSFEVMSREATEKTILCDLPTKLCAVSTTHAAMYTRGKPCTRRPCEPTKTSIWLTNNHAMAPLES